MSLTIDQYNFLLQAIAPQRVQQLRGMSHLEAWDVRRTLTRVFGIGGWDQELLSKDCVHAVGAEKRKRDKEGNEYGDPYIAWTVVYTATVRLVIRGRDGAEICHFDEGAAGDSVNQPSIGDAHDMALKTAISQALKRAAVNLGDQFGLSLYNNGSTKQVIHRTLAPPPAAQVLVNAASEETEMPVDEVNPEPVPQEHMSPHNQHEPNGTRR